MAHATANEKALRRNELLDLNAVLIEERSGILAMKVIMRRAGVCTFLQFVYGIEVTDESRAESWSNDSSQPRAAANCIPPTAHGMVTTGTPARLKGVV